MADESEENLLLFLALLLEVDRRANPQLYEPPSVGGSRSDTDS